MSKKQGTGKGTSQGHSGGGTSSVEYSQARKRRMDAARRREDKRWADLAGPVTVRVIPNESDGRAAVLEGTPEPTGPPSAFGWTPEQYDAALSALMNP